MSEFVHTKMMNELERAETTWNELKPAPITWKEMEPATIWHKVQNIYTRILCIISSPNNMQVTSSYSHKELY